MIDDFNTIGDTQSYRLKHTWEAVKMKIQDFFKNLVVFRVICPHEKHMLHVNLQQQQANYDRLDEKLSSCIQIEDETKMLTVSLTRQYNELTRLLALMDKIIVFDEGSNFEQVRSCIESQTNNHATY